MNTKNLNIYTLTAAMAISMSAIASENSYLESSANEPVISGSSECVQVKKGDNFPECEPKSTSGQIEKKANVVVIPKVETKPDKIVEVTNFAFDSAELSKDSKKVIDQLISEIKDPDTEKVTVVGHADSIGTKTYNKDLSERRASAVEDYLEKRGITSVPMDKRGLGETDPVANNDTAKGRAENRRVEIIVISDDQVAYQ